MTSKEFKKLTESKIVLLDGATGSNLMKKGMPSGVCPEKWILDNRDIMLGLQKEFIQAGTDILYAPTFTANRIKLAEYGYEDTIEEMNKALVHISREAADSVRDERQVYVAGDITMTGSQLYPIGTFMFEELVDVYKEQVRYLAEAGVDLIVVETMMSLQECRAAVLAVKETCDLPVMVTLTFNEDMRTLYGTDPVTAAVVLDALGVDAFGVNCSTGPEKMCEVIKQMREYTALPIIGKPNAGLPHLENGQTVYDMDAETFAKEAEKLTEAGAGLVGGCCGTTPEHIRLLAKRLKGRKPTEYACVKKRYLTTERKTVSIDTDGPFMVIGERINPTGKKALQAELKEGSLELVSVMAEEQIENGADILDVNVGMNGIDEKERMLEVIYHLTSMTDVPLSIDSSNIEVMEAALRIYPGRALINSISLETEKFEKLIPIAKKYGAMFILLPLSDSGLPKDIEEKKEIIHKILDRAYSFGMTKEDVVVDGLVNTVGANKLAALEALETIRYCKEELGVATVCGLSNISFGLPERQFVNSTFLAFAIKEGLTMAIANPSQDLLMNTAFASDLLLNKEGAAEKYIQRVTANPTQLVKKQAAEGQTAKKLTAGETSGGSSPVYEAVIKGKKDGIVALVKQELEKGTEPQRILDAMLIPAIQETGELFDKQIYFLPQLIGSAEAMKTAVDYLEPLLAQGKEKKPLATIVMATVEGDIHDIGKNLVVLMLKNYGFHVIDLGKDVPAEVIVQKAKEHNADIIGLSALMTTTMMEMKNVVDLARQEGVKSMIIVGGAVITKSFAQEIGADGYSKDAQDVVVRVKHLLQLD